MTDHEKIARAIVALSSDAPATLRVMAAITGLESLLPPPGTPEHRVAFAAAHGEPRHGEPRA